MYPIRPGSEEWIALTFTVQMVEATQVPASILRSMSTIGLYKTCAENPFGLDLYIVNSPQEFFDSSLDTYNYTGFKELEAANEQISIF